MDKEKCTILDIVNKSTVIRKEAPSVIPMCSAPWAYLQKEIVLNGQINQNVICTIHSGIGKYIWYIKFIS